MIKRILGIAPKLESDGSFSPSKLALKLATVGKTDFENISYTKFQGKRSKVLVIFTEQKNLKMQNGKMFSTGNHPVEALLSMVLKMAGVTIIGASPTSVLAFEVILNGMAMFNHANVRMPAFVDRILRWMVVTPDMHRIHHSIFLRETNRNFGFNLPWWDYLFGTYLAAPSRGHDSMTFGLKKFRSPACLKLLNILKLPFGRSAGIDTMSQQECV